MAATTIYWSTSSSSILCIIIFAILFAGNDNCNNCVSAMSANSKSYRGALIFLHGLGDSPRGWSNLEQTLTYLKPNLDSKNIKYKKF